MRRAAVIALAALLGGCSFGTVSPEEFERQFGVPPVPGAKAEVKVLSTPGLADCLAKLRTAVGESNVHATELWLYPTHASLKARSPRRPTDVDSYEYRRGDVAPSTPVKLSSGDENELSARTFAFADVDFDGLPALVDRTLASLALEGGKVSNVSIRKVGSVDDLVLVVRVAVTGARKDGSIEYDGRGKETGRNGVQPESDTLGADLPGAIAALRAAVGTAPVRVAELTLYEHWMTMAAESPPGSSKFVDFEYRHGRAHRGRSSSPALDGRTFDGDHLPLDVFAKVLAAEHAGEGNVSHVIIRPPYDRRAKDPQIRVYTKSNGYPTYDWKGNVVAR